MSEEHKKVTREEALEYHEAAPSGKFGIKITKPCNTQRDLSLAYTPGVAIPCKEIEANPEDAYLYTNKGNMVAVISNGSAVLGLGNIGALAGKPVFEGKCVLFKRFAGVDAIDIEVDSMDPDEIIHVIEKIAPGLGGINLEDIKAPECFEIETKLQERLDIPVFHDDQHGTAIISAAGLLNACQLNGKKLEDIRVVVNGAGAASIACSKLYISLGVKPENLIMCDSRGVIYKGRETGMNEFKEQFAVETQARSLEDALVGADAFMGLSIANCVSQEMVKSMAKKPIIFAMANPDPEITYEDAIAAVPDAIVATGRSDYPNQVNNVLGFPFLFRGALDVSARKINEEMKIAAVKSLAELAQKEVPYEVANAYGLKHLQFSTTYIIPKPIDPRVLYNVAPAVAQAAIQSGVARKDIDLLAYREKLRSQVAKGGQIMQAEVKRAQNSGKRVVYPEGEHKRIIKAAYLVAEDKLATPILLGRREIIEKKIVDMKLDFKPEIIDPALSDKREEYAELLFVSRFRKGITRPWAEHRVVDTNYFACMMLQSGDADGMLTGLTCDYPDGVKPILRLLGVKEGHTVAAGIYVMLIEDQALFFADCTINIEPNEDQLAEIAYHTAMFAKSRNIEPRVAFLSASNFGSVAHPRAKTVHGAMEKFKEMTNSQIVCDGEMQADTALVPEIVEEFYPFSEVKGDANILIFPNLASANISYKLLQRLGNATALGPILVGTGKAAHVMQKGDSEQDVFNMTAIVVNDIIAREESGH
ncbi:MAG: NADP-dependent malic enzyme [Lentisphaeria bacterium]|nr:NADP-dependent malic enzyme [Lentisphaeria bacterium]